VATRINGSGVLRGVVLDRQPLWRTTFSAMLDRFGFASVGLCATVDRFDRLVETMEPHLAIVDADGIGDVEAHVEAAVERLPRLVTIVASSDETGPEIAGAAHVSKCDVITDIQVAIEAVIMERIDWARLTSRELEILRLVAQGASNRQVGEQLWLSDQTIKFHLAQVYRKLQVASRREAVDRLREAGLLVDQSELDEGPEAILQGA
jgi:DNA-binding NarL/FixJ family response regulator